MERRTYLATAAGGAVFLAGCLGDVDPDSDVNGGDDDADDGGDPSDPGPSDPVENGTFDEFDDLDAWIVEDGSLSADPDRSVVGSQSALLEASRSDSRVMIKREFDSPRDLSESLPVLAVASDGPDAVIQLTDADGDRLLLRAALEPDGPLVARNFGIVDRAGTPDLSNVVHIKISAWAGDQHRARLWCDDLRFVSRPETGLVVLQFDDGFESTATHAAPVLDSHEYPATAFVRTDRVGEDGRLDADQLAALDEDGWTIGSHGAGATGFDWLDESEQEQQLSEAAEWFDDQGFEDVPFAYPNNNYNETTLELVEEYHNLAFASGYPVHGNLANPYLCPRVVNPSAEDAAQLLDRAAEYRGIVTIAYREFDQARLAAFEDTIEHLHDLESGGDLAVVLPSDLEEGDMD